MRQHTSCSRRVLSQCKTEHMLLLHRVVWARPPAALMFFVSNVVVFHCTVENPADSLNTALLQNTHIVSKQSTRRSSPIIARICPRISKDCNKSHMISDGGQRNPKDPTKW
jgi:hypothetical protein